jgi:hypothetical protein
MTATESIALTKHVTIGGGFFQWATTRLLSALRGEGLSAVLLPSSPGRSQNIGKILK